jgi:predicted dehydrogenase
MGKPLRVGLVGVGAISDWHVRAVRAVGMDVTAVSTRPGSERLRDFASRHAIADVSDGWREMLARDGAFDALVIATHTDATPDVLEASLPLGIPILVEKPVAWNSARLATLASRAHPKVIVGYNRRFYRPVREARREARSDGPLLAQATVPEDIESPSGDDPQADYMRPFFENSCHGIDLLRFLLGDLRVDSARRLQTPGGALAGIAATLSTERGDVVSFLGNWGAPANFGISLFRSGRRFDLVPFETATLYEGMGVIEPQAGSTVRRYVPRQTERIELEEVDRTEKPGFVAQAAALKQLAQGGLAPSEAATLEDARAAVALCEALSGVRYAE